MCGFKLRSADTFCSCLRLAIIEKPCTISITCTVRDWLLIDVFSQWKNWRNIPFISLFPVAGNPYVYCEAGLGLTLRPGNTGSTFFSGPTLTWERHWSPWIKARSSERLKAPGACRHIFHRVAGNRIRASITPKNSQSSLVSARLAFKEKVCVSVTAGQGVKRKVHFFGHKLNFLGELKRPCFKIQSIKPA